MKEKIEPKPKKQAKAKEQGQGEGDTTPGQGQKNERREPDFKCGHCGHDFYQKARPRACPGCGRNF